MELSSVLTKVRALVAKAEHPATPDAEADTARQMADALMLKYAVTEAQARDAMPAAERPQPGIITITIPHTGPLTSYVGWLVGKIASHTRCMVRRYTEYTPDGWECRVYGFEADLRYFELLYTTLQLHMLGVLRPEPGKNASLEENAYRLHNAGYNWLEIAGMYGWRKMDDRLWYHRETDTAEPATQVGSRIKRAYYRAVAARGEQPTKIAAGGAKTYRTSAAKGYVGRIGQRFAKLAEGREEGTGLVLANSEADLLAYFRDGNPDLFREQEPAPECEKCKQAKSGHCRQHPRGRAWKPSPFNAAAYERGSAHADTADLNATARAGSGARRALA